MLEIKRIKTGIDKLDKLLQGGFPKNSTILLVGAPGTCKTIFINQFVDKGLQEKETVLYITTDHSPREIKEMAIEFSHNFKANENKRLIFLDAYSWRTNEEKSKFAVTGLTDLNQMNITLSDALVFLGPVKKRIVIDSISSMILYTDADSVARFLQTVSAKSKASDSCLVMTIEEGVHDKKTINMLNFVSDGCIKLKEEDGKRFLKIIKMSQTKHPLDWIPFDIFGEGIDLL